MLIKNIVTIGGGTGSYRVLSGLRNIPGISIFAIASMADDGGSTGRLRKERGVLPGGDIRQCLAALSADKNIHDYLKLRREDGHMVGNVFLADLEKLMGNFEDGLGVAMKMLHTQGRVIPSTLGDAELNVLLADGQEIAGESKISEADLKIKDVEKVFYKNKIKINPKAAQAIQGADFIIICPGGFYNSIVPNLVVDGFKGALAQSKAKIIAIENLENKETENYLKKLEWYLGRSVNHLIPADNSLVSPEIIVKEPGDTVKRSILRHDSRKLAEAIAKIIQ